MDSHPIYLPVEEGQELVLIVTLQTVGPHGTEDSPDAADAQGGSQEAQVEQQLLLSRFQVVRNVMGVDVEIFKRERHHGKHGCTWRRRVKGQLYSSAVMTKHQDKGELITKKM